jgi:signal transduction histidine kinase
MWRALSEHLREPVPPRPSRPPRLDFAIAFLGALAVLVEGALRPGLPLLPLQVGVTLGIAATLVLRTTRPLVALALGLGLANMHTIVSFATAQEDLCLVTSALVLLHPYALLRHGSGREVAMGLGLVLATFAISAIAGPSRGAEDAIGSLVVLLFPAALGASLRFRDRAHRLDVVHTQLRERQMLARELHDTVAHHLAAIAIQSQAAHAVLTKKPAAAATALRAIDTEASRALAELRGLVGALRDDAPATLGPQAGLDAIEALVREAGEHAVFERVGALGSVAPSVELALHRIARESLHNAARHARGASRVEVSVRAEGEDVRLTIRDDGDGTRASQGGGFGLVGMKERASLLGGTLEAGPLPTRGWRVEAVLPRRGREGARP